MVRWLLALLAASRLLAAETVQVVRDPAAGPLVNAVAAELVGALGRMAPDERFLIADRAAGRAVRLVVDPAVGQPESFRLSTTGLVTTVAGADARGVAYGAYRLLERLGRYHTLSGDAEPAPRRGRLALDGPQVDDRPLCRRRIVFNWHNFLSSCSTWNLPDWQAWIRQSQKQGFNAVMVHAYGNNPMVSWQFGGQTKPTGYLTTSASGRDWGTQHVNDVRRLVGGDLFGSGVFGSDAALVPDADRPAAAKALMRRIFDEADRRRMDVYFALDVDTVSANPQAIIARLPRSARFKAGSVELVNPDTPEGDAYYRAQMAALMTDYPGLDELVVWFRTGGTPWRDLKVEQFPPSWRPAWQAALAARPELAGMRAAPSMFALARVVEACRRGLKAAGRPDVRLGFGTWHPDHLPAAHAFVARDVEFLWLDYSIVFDQPATLALNRSVGAERSVVPIVWAHHDDGQYLGRPFTPFAGFQTKLEQAAANGFGIIHWTTRPLDLYFRSLVEQTWQTTRDRPLGETCRQAAAGWFGQPALGSYLADWLTTGPIFGRETGGRLFDKTTDADAVTAGVERRLALLNAAASAARSREQEQRLAYFRQYERFCADFHRDQAALERSQALLREGRPDEAKAALSAARPEQTVRLYASAASLGRASRGELGLLVSLNLRWLPFFDEQRAALGLAPLRVRFGPTQHEPLAQGAGTRTYFVDTGRQVWLQRGEHETGRTVVTFNDGEELSRAGLRFDQPFTHTVPYLAPGRYRARALLRAGVGAERCALSVAAASEVTWYELPAAPARRLRLVSHTSPEVPWTTIHEVRLDGLLPAETRASGALPDYPAAAATDGKPETRWAVQGPSAWLELGLRPGTTVSRLGLAWFANAQRRPPDIEVQLSADGAAWGPLRPLPPLPSAVAATAEPSRPRGELLERSLLLDLSTGGRLDVTITPQSAAATLCALVLEPFGR